MHIYNFPLTKSVISWKKLYFSYFLSWNTIFSQKKWYFSWKNTWNTNFSKEFWGEVWLRRLVSLIFNAHYQFSFKNGWYSLYMRGHWHSLAHLIQGRRWYNLVLYCLGRTARTRHVGEYGCVGWMDGRKVGQSRSEDKELFSLVCVSLFFIFWGFYIVLHCSLAFL